MRRQEETGAKTGRSTRVVSRLRRYVFAYAFVILLVIVGVSAYVYYTDFAAHFRAEVESQLSSIGQLKADGLADWRREWYANAAVLHEDAAFAVLVRRCLDDPSDVLAEAEVRARLESLQRNQRYDRVRLLDSQGATRLSVPAVVPPVASAIAESLPGVRQSAEVTLVDFYCSDVDGGVHLVMLVPIVDGGDSHRVLAVVVLRIDPTIYLYPYIARWPTPSETAETLLIRRDGNDALFLNDLRFQEDAALRLRIPLASADVPAVKAALGQVGIVEGVDYRGVRVIADVRSVPGSPWFIVARIDTQEAYAPLRDRLWVIVGLVGVGLLGAGAGLMSLWRRQQAGLNRERAEAMAALGESEERFSLALEATADGVYDVDFATKKTHYSPGYAKMLGYLPTELPPVHETWEGLLHPDDKERALRVLDRCLKGEADSYDMDFRLRTKTGDWRWIQSRGRVMRRDVAGNPLRLVGAHRDITERRLMQEVLRDREQELAGIIESSRVNRAGSSGGSTA